MAKAKPPTAGPANQGLRVAHKAAGSFWRGGHEFTQEPRTIPLADLTPDQADEIETEGDKPGGWLMVVRVDIDTTAAAA